MLTTGFDEQSWLIRRTLEHCSDYDCAHNYLANVPTTSVGYYILAGTKGEEGVIIARDNWGPAHQTYLNSTVESNAGGWFLVQANSDHWKPEVLCHGRCQVAHDLLVQLGQEAMTNVTLRETVLKHPGLVRVETLYNTDFTPSAGYT